MKMPARSAGLLPPPVPAPKIAAPCHKDAKQDHALASPRFPESARQQQCAQRPAGGRPLHRHDEMPLFGDCAFCGWRALQPLRRTHPRRGRGTRDPGGSVLYSRRLPSDQSAGSGFSPLFYVPGAPDWRALPPVRRDKADRQDVAVDGRTPGRQGTKPAIFFRNMKTRATQFHVGKEM